MSVKRNRAAATDVAVAAGAVKWTRKNMEMDAAKLEAARRILGVRTEKETVDRALDQVVFRSEVLSALDRLAAAGGIEDIYGNQE